MVNPFRAFPVVLALALLRPAAVSAVEAPVRIVVVEPVATEFNAEARLLRKWHPARFRVTLENRTGQTQRGGLAAEVVGNLDTVYGLPTQAIALGPHEKKTVALAWHYPSSVTHDGAPIGPVTVPGATWGHELNVAWLDGAGKILDRGQTVFIVDPEGQCAKAVQELARAAELTPQQMFTLRYGGYLSNAAFEAAPEPEDLTLTLPGHKLTGLKRGTAPSGCATLLAQVEAKTSATTARLTVKKGNLRLQRAWLAPANGQGPSAQRLWHRANQKESTFEVPPTQGEATLVLEFDRGHYVAPVPLADMAARGEKQFGKFRSFLEDRAAKPITTAEQWAAERQLLRQAIRKALGTPLEAKSVPLEPRLVSEEVVPPLAHINGLARSYVRRKVSIRVSEGERMNIWLLVPPGIGPFPAVVANHQTVADGKDEPIGLGGAYYQVNYGPFLASRGFVVVAADSWGAGERLAPGSDHAYDTSARDAKEPRWSLLGQRLHDHMRVIDYLETLPFVDRDRIGAIGHSLGGESTAVLTACDERVRVAVLSCGFTLMRSLDNAADIYTAKGNAILSMEFRKLLEVPVKERKLPFDFDDCMALWAPRPIFWHGVQDDLWPNAPQVAQALQALQQVYKLHGASDRLEVVYSAQAHCFPQWVQADAFDWLEYWLKGPRAR
jgi:dienelactone hydrolase